MSKVLFWDVPLFGHVNPSLGLVEELSQRGEQVIYYSTDTFKSKIEQAGAIYRYNYECDVFQKILCENQIMPSAKSYIEFFNKVLTSIDPAINYMIEQHNLEKFDYIVYGSLLTYGKILSEILEIPSISMFSLLASVNDLTGTYKDNNMVDYQNIAQSLCYHKISDKISLKYGIKFPLLQDLFFNKGDLNIIFTSKSFMPNPEYYDSSYIFMGPASNPDDGSVDFPFDKLINQKVIYISLGTIFGATEYELYQIFFDAFKDTEYIVVMSAHNADMHNMKIPPNFIIRNYIPQTKLLKYIKGAIIHGGANTTNDLLKHAIPFIVIPIANDQFFMGKRCEALHLAICLDKKCILTDTSR